MNISEYKQYISSETMMGPSSVRILEELFDRYPLKLSADSLILDLGCGRGLTTLVIAKETGARVYANDLWISEEENRRRFEEWGIGGQVTPVCEDANDLHFERKLFDALFSIDAYHYFAGSEGFFEEKILPFMNDGGAVLIGIPGLKSGYEGREEELLDDWATGEAHMFKTPERWKQLIGKNDRIEAVETWEMACFDKAWNEWLESDHEFAKGDSLHFEKTIKPYTCFVGIYVKVR